MPPEIGVHMYTTRFLPAGGASPGFNSNELQLQPVGRASALIWSFVCGLLSCDLRQQAGAAARGGLAQAGLVGDLVLVVFFVFFCGLVASSCTQL